MLGLAEAPTGWMAMRSGVFGWLANHGWALRYNHWTAREGSEEVEEEPEGVRDQTNRIGGMKHRITRNRLQSDPG